VELHIDELVLYGVAEGQRIQIGEAIARSWTSLIAEHPAMLLPGQDHDLASLDGGSFTIDARSIDESIGDRIAQTLYRQFRQWNQGH
jgi:predicted short-subunit dehydrogenase-like oxidoreductase (DUF2520 family)